MKTRLPHFPELDGLRGIAALAVFFHHFLQTPRDHPLPAWPLWIKGLLDISAYGSFGVDIFFGLSGFLITSLLLVDRESPAFFNNFYWRRVLRIMPVYLVHLLLAAVLVPGSTGYIVLALLFIVNYAARFHVADAGPAWTLAIEEQFYLLWPQVIRRLRITSVYYLSFALIGLSITLRIVVPLLHHGSNLRFTFYRFDGLALGAVLACQWFSPHGRTPTVQSVLNFLHSHLAIVIVLLAQALALLFFHTSLLYEAIVLTTVNFLVYRLLRRIVFLGRRSRFTWLDHPILTWFGAISYALYMYHMFVLQLFERSFGPIDPTHVGNTAWRAALALAVTVAACVLSRFCIELPAQRLRRFVLKPSTHPAP